ncbi:hypothetical protein AALP_AA4G183400 [Arabis alpina]|uniref:Inhibitor I9 domain-containing protein n=1 Tax=Arabis alpina TaxID=50452 RepID=A0A087H425_ARAAL|nr:hypothetical protein AALP_AA4G183400 [Arabis alpina]
MKFYVVGADLQVYPNVCEQSEQILHKVLLNGRSPKDTFVNCRFDLVNVFSARLTNEEAKKLKGENGISMVAEEVLLNFEEVPTHVCKTCDY